MTLEDYYRKYGSLITQRSEKLFLEEFLYPLVKENIGAFVPQKQFIDRTGKSRRIDFAYQNGDAKIAIEIDGESYHAEGILPAEMFDDSLFRQNEIIRHGYKLIRFSYSQLQSPQWREIVLDSLRNIIEENAPNLLQNYSIEPNPIQVEALQELHYARNNRGWKKGVVVMPTGTGKTILSAIDAKRHGGRALFIVHRLDILSQSINAYKKAWGNINYGVLTGNVKENIFNCDVLFASKDSIRAPDILHNFSKTHFDYIVIDEVHHGQSPSYQSILRYFNPKFMLGMTATPDRTDRKDIFELFDYNKIYEISLHEVIDRGFLVPYTYIGLTDNIDYSKIRHDGHKYRVDDLEKFLIIPERNEAILNAYLDPNKGSGDKAIGFCVSIKHAERMANFFSENGINAVAIHSNTENRDELLRKFADDEIQIVFTVDLFNEGVDFPNVRVLLFLRPTESKTVFLQQLGRGLRLCSGKDRVRVLDFIGNYKRANQIRKYLSKGSRIEQGTDNHGKRQKKILYEYSTGCEVIFDEEVEEILDRQDRESLGVDKEDLIAAYFELAEKLERKPTKADLDETCYPSRLYIQHWRSWRNFLQDIGEYTEASYHYPQGTHLGHILSILWYAGLPNIEETHLGSKYIKMRGGLSSGREGIYQRQLKYKLQAAMELGIIVDDRTIPSSRDYKLELTAEGMHLRELLEDELAKYNLAFPLEDDGVPATRMEQDEAFYNQIINAKINEDPRIKEAIYDIFLNMNAVQQMLRFLFHIKRKKVLQKQEIYAEFFQAPFVKRFCEQEGIEEATIEASKRRCPFLINILSACGILTATRNSVEIKKIVITPSLIRPNEHEPECVSISRLEKVRSAWPNSSNKIGSSDLSISRELFGSNFLTDEYFVQDLEIYY